MYKCLCIVLRLCSNPALCPADLLQNFKQKMLWEIERKTEEIKRERKNSTNLPQDIGNSRNPRDVTVKSFLPPQGENCWSMSEDGETRMGGTTHKGGDSQVAAQPDRSTAGYAFTNN